MGKQWKSIAIICFIVIGFGLWLWGVNDPYVGSYNANNNYLSLAAKNYIRFGFGALKTIPTYVTGPDLPRASEYYLHHPFVTYWFVLLPFLVFGFSNWVVHVSMFIFTAGMVVMIYFVGKEIWNRRIGYVAALLATVFPAITFFWKFMLFEQITLFFTMVIIFSYVRFVKSGKRTWLIWLAASSFVSTVSDWYGAYLIFPFAYMLTTPYRKRTIPVLKVYIPAVSSGLLLFFFVLAATGHVGDASNAVLTRSVQSELTGLTYWWLRLPVVLFLRFLIYFTPFAVCGIFIFARSFKYKLTDIAPYMLSFFCILGILNFVFLPTASWGHAYFIYYCVPFFAYSIALCMSRFKKGIWRYLLFFIVILWSVAVNFGKVGQVRKQAWKYQVSTYVSSIVSPHETIGVINYPGDVLQNYYLINAIAFNDTDGEDWVESKTNTDIHLVIFTCKNDCDQQERSFIQEASEKVNIQQYDVDGSHAWILRNDKLPEKIDMQDKPIGVTPSNENNGLTKQGFAVMLAWYRQLKRIIGEVQL